MKQTIALFLIICMLALPLAGKDQGRSVSWSEVNAMVTGKIVSLTLAGDSRVKGKALEANQNGLRMAITRSSNKSAYPLGEVLIPRSAVSTIVVSKQGGYKWTVAGTAIGGGIGAVLGSAAAKYANNEGAQWSGIIAALVIIPTALGFLAGYFSDHGNETISVQP